MFDDTKAWTSNLFGTANLGDLRRTKRLITLTSDLASSVGDSMVKASQIIINRQQFLVLAC